MVWERMEGFGPEKHRSQYEQRETASLLPLFGFNPNTQRLEWASDTYSDRELGEFILEYIARRFDNTDQVAVQEFYKYLALLRIIPYKEFNDIINSWIEDITTGFDQDSIYQIAFKSEEDSSDRYFMRRIRSEGLTMPQVVYPERESDNSDYEQNRIYPDKSAIFIDDTSITAANIGFCIKKYAELGGDVQKLYVYLVGCSRTAFDDIVSRGVPPENIRFKYKLTDLLVNDADHINIGSLGQVLHDMDDAYDGNYYLATMYGPNGNGKIPDTVKPREVFDLLSYIIQPEYKGVAPKILKKYLVFQLSKLSENATYTISAHDLRLIFADDSEYIDNENGSYFVQLVEEFDGPRLSLYEVPKENSSDYHIHRVNGNRYQAIQKLFNISSPLYKIKTAR